MVNKAMKCVSTMAHSVSSYNLHSTTHFVAVNFRQRAQKFVIRGMRPFGKHLEGYTAFKVPYSILY